MKKILYTLFLLLCISAYSQRVPLVHQCATDEHLKESLRADPFLQERIDAMNQQLREHRQKRPFQRLNNPPQRIIPVVIYVVHDGTAAVNISDAQVNSQLQALNANFSGAGLRFCLATKTETSATLPMPSGAVQSTPGVIHVNDAALSNHSMTETGQTMLQGGTASSPTYNMVSSKYLRIYVVKSINGASSGILGYATFPGQTPFFDGIVMRYDAFGDATSCNGCNLYPANNLGRVLVHEVGHYLNLYHTFQGGCSGDDASSCSTGGDFVCDTPQVQSPNGGCPAAVNTCGINMPDQINNFMDYTNDACRTQFTTGQTDRMNDALDLFRSRLVSIDNLIETGVCGASTMLSATFKASTYQICTNSGITFTPLVPNAANTTYQWDFGDPASGAANTSAGTAAVSHIYASSAASPYTVTLTLTRAGETFTYSTQVYVSSCTPIANGEARWVLSSANGLNFSTGVPVPDTTMPAANLMMRGCAIQNNAATGATLFYTNGKKIWSGNHSVVNTTSNAVITLKGNNSATNGVVSVPNPANPNSYYIFTKGAMMNPSDNNLLDGLTSTVVNVNGGVVSVPDATLNQPVTALPGMTGFLTGNGNALYGGCTIAAMRHCDRYYIFTTFRKADGNYLTVLALTTSGLSYVSSVAIPNNSLAENIVISPDGNRVLYLSWQSPILYRLFDFNKYTGTLSNPVDIFTPNKFVQEAAFSPDSKLLYGSEVNSAFIQYNVSAANPAATRRILSSSIPDLPLIIKKGPDNKIYFIKGYQSESSYKMGVIHDPNQVDNPATVNACELSFDGPVLPRVLASSVTYYCLPSVVSGVAANSISSHSTACRAFKFFPNLAPGTCFTSFVWNFGDSASGSANSSTASNPEHTFTAPGQYTVSVSSSTGALIATTVITVEPAPTAQVFGDTTACLSGNAVTYNSVQSDPSQSVSWSVTGGAGTFAGTTTGLEAVVTWTQLPGILTVTVTNAEGCATTVTQVISNYCNTAGANDIVHTGELQADNKIIFGGEFTTYNNTPINRIARLNTDMSLDTSFNVGTGTDGVVSATAIQADGKIIIGGAFSSYNGIARSNLARLQTNGTLDTSFAIGSGFTISGYPAQVQAVAIQADGKILVGGIFDSFNGTEVYGLVRLTATGQLDHSFMPGFTSTDHRVYAIAVQADGKIIVGGSFDMWSGTAVGNIMRLNSNGTIDTTFAQGTGVDSIYSSVQALRIQPDGKILVGGDFYRYNGVLGTCLIRLNTDASLDTSFLADMFVFTGNSYVSVTSIDLQADGKIIAGGGFVYVGSFDRRKIVRLHANGTVDSTLDPGVGFTPFERRGIMGAYTKMVIAQPDGKIIAGGYFTAYNNQPAYNIARINATGSSFSRMAAPGVAEKEAAAAQQGLALYPNPVKDNLVVSLNEDKADNVEIYNIYGQRVRAQQLRDKETNIQVSGLAVGVYIVKVYNGGELVRSQKVIKQ